MSKPMVASEDTFVSFGKRESSAVEGFKFSEAPKGPVGGSEAKRAKRAADRPAVMPVVGDGVVIGLGLSLPDTEALECVVPAGMSVVSVEDNQSLFSCVERRGAIALVVQSSPERDPMRLATILRQSGYTLPIFVICDTELEASYFGMRRDLAPMTGLVETFEGGGEALLEMVLSAHMRSTREDVSEALVTERGLAQIFLDLCFAGATGILRITRDAVERAVYFLDGEPINADSNLLDENFGRFLLGRGIINFVEYRWSQQLQQREGVRQGEALCKIGVLNDERLQRLLGEQIFNKIQNSFGAGACHVSFSAEGAWLWRDSVYHFELMDLLTQGLWRTTPESVQRERWSSMEDQYLILQPRGCSGFRIPAHYFDAAFDASFGVDSSVCVVKIADLFDEDTTLRERLAVIDVLLLSHSGRMIDEPPNGLRVFEPGVGYSRSRPIDLVGLELLEEACLGEGTAPASLLYLDKGFTREELEHAFRKLKSCFDNDRFEQTIEIAHRLKRINARIEYAYHALKASPEQAQSIEQRTRVARRAVAAYRANSIEAEAIYHDGVDLLRNEKYEGALEHFYRAQSLNPNEPLYVLYESWARVNTEVVGSDEWRRGVKQLRSALETSPTMVMGYIFLARCALMDSAVTDAIKNLQIALQIEPSNDEARVMLEGISAKSTDPDALHC